jgi:hypothetical protein
LWSVFLEYRRFAALGFGVLAATTNVACVVVDIWFHGLGGLVLAYLGWFLMLPLIVGLGAAWATVAARNERLGARSSTAREVDEGKP